MLKDSIVLELGDEGVVGDDGLVAALGHDGQILKQLLVIADWQDDSGAVAVLVREILQGLAHDVETLRRFCFKVERAETSRSIRRCPR